MPTPKRVPKSPEQRKAESRDALLAAGCHLLLEEEHRSPFAALGVSEICEQAGYTSGAFYNHWPTTDAYFAALSTYLLSGGASYDADFEQLREVADSVDISDPLAATAELADADLKLLIDNEYWDAIELFQITWGRREFQRESAEGYRLVDSQTAGTYGRLLERLGRAPRAPLSLEQIGTILQALVEGFGLRHRIDPESIAGSLETGPDFNLYAIAAASLLAALTTAGDDRRGAPEMLRDELRNREPA